MRAWQEKETFAFNGRFNQQRYVNIWPRPIQQPHPPVWIPGGGSVETWQWCAEMDYVYCYLSYYGYKAGPGDHAGLLERDGSARQGPQSLPRRLPPVRRRRREPVRGDGALRRSRRIFLRPLPARRSALRLAAGLQHRGDDARRPGKPGQARSRRSCAAKRRRNRVTTNRRTPSPAARPAPPRARASTGRARHGGDRRARLRHRRLAEGRRRAAASTSPRRSTSATS